MRRCPADAACRADRARGVQGVRPVASRAWAASARATSSRPSETSRRAAGLAVVLASQRSTVVQTSPASRAAVGNMPVRTVDAWCTPRSSQMWSAIARYFGEVRAQDVVLAGLVEARTRCCASSRSGRRRARPRRSRRAPWPRPSASRRGRPPRDSWPEIVLSRSSSSSIALVVGATLAGQPEQQLPAQVGVDREAVELLGAVEQAAEQVERLVAVRRLRRGRARTRAAGRCRARRRAPGRAGRAPSGRPRRRGWRARCTARSPVGCGRRASGPRTGRSRRRCRAAPGRPSPTHASRRRGSCPRRRPRTGRAAATRSNLSMLATTVASDRSSRRTLA